MGLLVNKYVQIFLSSIFHKLNQEFCSCNSVPFLVSKLRGKLFPWDKPIFFKNNKNVDYNCSILVKGEKRRLNNARIVLVNTPDLYSLPIQSVKMLHPW